MKLYAVTCHTDYDKWGESYDDSIVKIFSDRARADAFCAEKNKTARKEKNFDETYSVEETEGEL